MQLRKQNILFFARTMNLGGTENVVLQLCEIFKPLVNKIVVCSCGGVNVEKLHEINIRHYTIPDIENKSLSTMLAVSKKLKQIVNDEYITVIHTHHRMAAFYVRFLRLNKKTTFINTSHNTFNNRRAFTRYAYKKANLITCGEMVKRNLQDVYGLANVTVIHNAVKPFDGKIVVDEKLKNAKDNGKFLIGNIGRLSEQKGMEYFIQAVPFVLATHPETHFFIIGTGEEEEKLKKMSEGLPVTFMGYRADIQNLMSQLDLIVLSSLWEGFPLIPIEAFSVGTIVVGTGVDGTLEIVKDGENGILVEARNAERLAKRITWVYEHPEQRKRIELAAKATFENEFSFDVLAQSYTDYYRSL